MKIEDVIDQQKKAIEFLSKPENYSERTQITIEQCEIISAALEKQIPKEPVQAIENEPVMIGDFWECLDVIKYKCQCGAYVKKDQKYCDGCGQRLK